MIGQKKREVAVGGFVSDAAEFLDDIDQSLLLLRFRGLRGGIVEVLQSPRVFDQRNNGLRSQIVTDGGVQLAFGSFDLCQTGVGAVQGRKEIDGLTIGSGCFFEVAGFEVDVA